MSNEHLKEELSTALSRRAEVLDETDGRYHEKKTQFASYKGSIEEAERNISPNLIVIPFTKNDVCTIIRICSKYGCKITPRSGGHQYCGLSSGPSVVQIDMTNFDDVKIGRDDGKDVVVRVEAGVRLEVLYSRLHEKELLIPGGNCLNVAAGGHFQSSASGHFTKSFGLGLDWMVEAEIVLPDGELVTATANEHSDLFWAIRGGSPGAFGVILSYRIKAIKVSEYKHAYLARFIWHYEKEAETCHQVLTNFVDIVKHPAYDKLKDATLSFTIGPNPFSSNHTHHDIIVTVMWTGVDSGSIYNQVPNHLNMTGNDGLTFHDIMVTPFTQITDGYKDMTEAQYPQHKLSYFMNMLALPDPAGPTKRAARQAMAKLRYEPKGPMITMKMTMKNLTTYITPKKSRSGPPKATVKRYTNVAKFTGDMGFDTKMLADTVDERMDALLSSGAELGTVFQFIPLDMTKTTNDGSTAFPMRHIKFGYDVWGLWSSCENDVAQRASEWANKTDQDLERVLGGPSKTGNLIFATNGKLDITNPDVRRRYYPDDDVYDRLCDIKGRYDPTNTFSTVFTIPPNQQQRM